MAQIVARGLNPIRAHLMGGWSLLVRGGSAPTTQVAKNISSQAVVRRTLMDGYNQRILRSHVAGKSTLPPWWWWEKFVMCVVFAITGSTTAFFVRPFIEKVLHLEGSLWNGPWSYRVAYSLQIYSVLLVVVGTIFGRHAFFKRFAKRMWTRMVPKFG